MCVCVYVPMWEVVDVCVCVWGGVCVCVGVSVCMRFKSKINRDPEDRLSNVLFMASHSDCTIISDTNSTTSIIAHITI